MYPDDKINSFLEDIRKIANMLMATPSDEDGAPNGPGNDINALIYNLDTTYIGQDYGNIIDDAKLSGTRFAGRTNSDLTSFVGLLRDLRTWLNVTGRATIITNWTGR